MNTHPDTRIIKKLSMSMSAQSEGREVKCVALKSVLLVDDNPDDVKLAEHAFKKLKLKNPVEVVSTADEMKAYLEAEGKYRDREAFPYPSLIILDLNLPGTNGLEAQAWLRTKLKHRTVPLIMISSLEHRLHLRGAVSLGANAYMVKPFNATLFKELADGLMLPVEFGR
ncbi:MAG: response regulator [Limisphaerales bacterium]